MPSCFQLLDKVSNQPVSLSLVDELICREVYQTEPHPKWYGGDVFNWFDSIGFQIATGKSLVQVREYYNSNPLWAEELPYIIPALIYIESNYNAKSFYAVNR